MLFYPLQAWSPRAVVKCGWLSPPFIPFSHQPFMLCYLHRQCQHRARCPYPSAIITASWIPSIINMESLKHPKYSKTKTKNILWFFVLMILVHGNWKSIAVNYTVRVVALVQLMTVLLLGPNKACHQLGACAIHKLEIYCLNQSPVDRGGLMASINWSIDV